MTIKVAINGYGRIGRNVLRAFFEYGYDQDITIVAINGLGSFEHGVHLTRYDSTHGPFHGEVAIEDHCMVIAGHRIQMLNERDPAKLPWKDLGVDVVYECTGKFTDREGASLHLQAGAKKVLISAPGKNADATVVYGVNENVLQPTDTIVSNASCTTNCLAPLAKVLHDNVGIEQGLMTTIHAYTNDQNLLDNAHKDLRRARSATQSMIPTKTGAAQAVGLVLPDLNGRLAGCAVRVPTMNVSLVDLNFIAQTDVSKDQINQLVKSAAGGAMQGILGYSDLPLVSIDFNHDSRSSIFDANQTMVIGRLVKVMAWYDNEWGFSVRMLDVTKALMAS